MSKKKLSFSSSLFLSSMLFGLFFGAGNLILPVQVGENSGSSFIIAMLGFVFTAVGLPFLAVAAFGASKKENVYAMGSMVNKTYSKIFTILLYLTIGPVFALPRTCTVAFEVGFANFESKPIHLFIFSIIFFTVALMFALKPTKILTWVGKILNPIFLIFFFILFASAIIKPMGDISNTTNPSYASPFFKGFTEGYQTMDILAALAFGSIVTKNIHKLGITKSKRVSFETVKSGFFTSLLMAFIYICLAWLGSTALNIMGPSLNGGIALNKISTHYFGNFGSIFLAITVTVACLKTAVGLITACSEVFHEHLPFKLSIKQYTFIVTIMTAIFANFGLNRLIELAVPVLMFLYPLAVTLTILGLLTPWIKDKKSVYVFSSIGAGIAAFFDMLNSTPDVIKKISFISSILNLFSQYVPLFKVNMSWILPMILGLIFGFIYEYFKSKKSLIT